jgi:hypothetical protein
MGPISPVSVLVLGQVEISTFAVFFFFFPNKVDKREKKRHIRLNDNLAYL